MPTGNRDQTVNAFIQAVHDALDDAVRVSGLSQQEIGEVLEVNRATINRKLSPNENLTLVSLGEFAWALGLELLIELRAPHDKTPSKTPTPKTGFVQGQLGTASTNVTRGLDSK